MNAESGYYYLHQVADPFFAVAREKINYGNFNHRVTSRLLTHGSAGNTNQNLCCQGRVIDAHIEFK